MIESRTDAVNSAIEDGGRWPVAERSPFSAPFLTARLVTNLCSKNTLERATGYARVTQDLYDTFAAMVAEVPGRTPSALARQVLERVIYEAPAEAKIMVGVLAPVEN
jgi:hypothetical protein